MYEGPWITSISGTGALIFYQFPIAASNNDSDKQPHLQDFSLNISPNPAIDETLAIYTVPSTMQVSIDIFNVLGKLVTKINQQNIPAGEHLIPFNVFTYPAGEYFCRLQAGNKVLTKKIIVAK